MIKSTGLIESNVKEIQDVIARVSDINILKGKTIAIADQASELFEAVFSHEFIKAAHISSRCSDTSGVDRLQLEKPSTLGSVVWLITGRTPYFHENLNEVFRRLVNGGKLLLVAIVSVSGANGVAAPRYPNNDVFSLKPENVMDFQELILNTHDAGFGGIEVLLRKDFILQGDKEPFTTFSIAAISAERQCIGQVFEGCPAACNKCG